MTDPLAAAVEAMMDNDLSCGCEMCVRENATRYRSLLLAAAPALLAAIVGEMERTPGGSVTVDFDYILPESLLAALTAALGRLT